MPIVRLSVNGLPVSAQVEPATLLVDLLRGELALTGTHVGCDTRQCGACTVLLRGDAVKSCTVLAVQAEGAEVTTIEGISSDGKLHPLQESFATEGGAQCGICTPGMIMAALHVPRGASTSVIQETLAGNLCRCTGYEAIYRSVKKAAGKTRTRVRAGR